MDIEQIEDALISAIDTGEILTIIYRGGSRPGAARQIQPRSIDDNKIRALDVSSGRDKQFIIEKIEITDESALKQEYKPDIYHREATIDQLIQYHAKKAERLGWMVVVNNYDIELYSRFKNGNLRKTPDAAIHYEEFVIDLIIDIFGDEEEIEEKRKSSRPWHVEGRSFKDPQKAFRVFLDTAIEKAPSTKE